MKDLQEALIALQLGGSMIYPLVFLTLLALVLTLDKIYVYWRYVRLPTSLLELIENHDFDWSTVSQNVKALGPKNYYHQFFSIIISNHQKPSWWVSSRAADEAQVIEKALSRGIWLLETTVTAAPLLGLLGTITGMMHSFNLIGAGGIVDPTGVTGGVAQALIATAMGLLIALLALFAFNYFSRLQAQTLDDMERLGTRLIDNIRLLEDSDRKG